MHCTTTRIAIAVMALVLVNFSFGQDRPDVDRLVMPFDRVAMDVASSSGENVAAACQKAIAMHPYAQPYDWPEARATLRLDEDATFTDVTVHLTRVRPHTRYTTWLRRAGASSARPIGRHVWSDASGNATLLTRLPFRVIDAKGGADTATDVMVRVASHCADHPGRVPSSGPGEPWFEWRFSPERTPSDASSDAVSAPLARTRHSMSVPT